MREKKTPTKHRFILGWSLIYAGLKNKENSQITAEMCVLKCVCMGLYEIKWHLSSATVNEIRFLNSSSSPSYAHIFQCSI